MNVFQDIRFGARQLWRAPLFTVAAVATLALGIGANTALFTLGSAILVKPLQGIGDSHELAWVMWKSRSGRANSMSYPDYLDYKSGLGAVMDLAGSTENHFSLSGNGEPVRVSGLAVTGNYFTVLRTPFALGRGFTPADDSVGVSQPVVVLSFGLWQQRFAGDSAVIGQRVTLNGLSFTVVGVTAPGFNGADLDEPRSVFLPFAAFRQALPGFVAWDNRVSRWMKGIGRIKSGVSYEQAESAVNTVGSRIIAADTVRKLGLSAGMFPAKSGVPPGSEGEIVPVALLATVVTGLILLLACANVSNLLLARGVSRRREIGIRLSLGATRGRLVSQLLTESTLLALLSTVVGTLIAYVFTDWMLTSGILPVILDVRPDVRVLAFAVAAAGFAAIVFGLIPAMEATRSDLVAAVKDGTQGRDPRRARIQSGFVVAQLALSLVLLTTAGLFLRSMYKASRVDVGYEATSQVVGVSFDLGLQNYSETRATNFINTMAERALGVPGVQSASFTDTPPMGSRYVIGDITLEGQTDDQVIAGKREQVYVTQASIRPGYFGVIGMRLLAGRDFATNDTKSAPGVVILSQATAARLWPNESPLGKRVRLRGASSPLLTVVGIAPDVMLGGTTERVFSTAYMPLLQYQESARLTMLVRTAADPGALATAMQRAVRSLDADLPLFDVQTLAQYKELKLKERVHGASILAGFGGLALLLAAIGVYGVMAFTVMQRTREIGIRIALGASAGDVVGQFVGRGMRLTVIGVAIGLGLSLAVSRLLQSMLYGLTPTDGATFAGVAVILAIVALAATWLPARRAALVDPLLALRSE